MNYCSFIFLFTISSIFALPTREGLQESVQNHFVEGMVAFNERSPIFSTDHKDLSKAYGYIFRRIRTVGWDKFFEKMLAVEHLQAMQSLADGLGVGCGELEGIYKQYQTVCDTVCLEDQGQAHVEGFSEGDANKIRQYCLSLGIRENVWIRFDGSYVGVADLNFVGHGWNYDQLNHDLVLGRGFQRLGLEAQRGCLQVVGARIRYGVPFLQHKIKCFLCNQKGVCFDDIEASSSWQQYNCFLNRDVDCHVALKDERTRRCLKALYSQQDSCHYVPSERFKLIQKIDELGQLRMGHKGRDFRKIRCRGKK